MEIVPKKLGGKHILYLEQQKFYKKSSPINIIWLKMKENCPSQLYLAGAMYKIL